MLGLKPRTVQADGHVHGVIVGCQSQEGNWLLIRRSESVAAPLKVCFPGGAVDGDESQDDAVAREMLEEVGAIVKPLVCVWQKKFDELPLTLWGWQAELQSDNVIANPKEVAEILWLTADEIHHHPDTMAGTSGFLYALLAIQHSNCNETN